MFTRAGFSMANHPETGVFDSEVIRNVGGALPWLARMPKQPELPNPGWFTPGNLTAVSSHEARQAVEGLARSLRKRHDAVSTVASPMMDKLQAEVESTKPGTIMDPEGTGVQALEESEQYFRAECEELSGIKEALERSEIGVTHGADVFKELERVNRLFAAIVSWSQRIRWRLVVNDGTLAPTTGRTFTSGADLISSLDDA